MIHSGFKEGKTIAPLGKVIEVLRSQVLYARSTNQALHNAHLPRSFQQPFVKMELTTGKALLHLTLWKAG